MSPEEKYDICRKCPLFITIDGDDFCNSELYYNPTTNKTSWIKREGYKNGCGCFLEHKTQDPGNHCPIHKW